MYIVLSLSLSLSLSLGLLVSISAPNTETHITPSPPRYSPPPTRYGIAEEDLAKRLMDYGFHAPTMSWPVPGALMVEPTESESKGEMDRLINALIDIRAEIQEIMDGKVPLDNNLLKNAPHTADVLLGDAEWDRPYSRSTAAYPEGPKQADNKFWPTVSRIDGVFGDRNLVCTCDGMDMYADVE